MQDIQDHRKSYLVMGMSFKRFLTSIERLCNQAYFHTNINPQANAILERFHQVLGDMLHTKNLQEYDFDKIDPWSELLALVAWAIHSTHHTTLQSTLDQLVFRRDMLLNIKFIVD